MKQHKASHWNKPALVTSLMVTSLLLWTNTAAQSPVDLYGYDVASAERFVFSPRTHQWRAIDANGDVVRSGRGSGGRAYCHDTRRQCKTPTGTFAITYKGGAGCRSSRYPLGRGGAPMPYCMFFTKYYGIHGSHDVPNYNASHGCVRVSPQDAKWLYHNFIKTGTTVVIKPY